MVTGQAGKHARAWLALTLALALHLAGEAANDFLSFYNPSAASLEERLPWLPLPVFTFDVWLAALIGAVILLLGLARGVYRGARWTVAGLFVYGGLMTLNAPGHFGAFFYYRRSMPGVLSSPLLLAAGIWLVAEAWRRTRAT